MSDRDDEIEPVDDKSPSEAESSADEPNSIDDVCKDVSEGSTPESASDEQPGSIDEACSNSGAEPTEAAGDDNHESNSSVGEDGIAGMGNTEQMHSEEAEDARDQADNYPVDEDEIAGMGNTRMMHEDDESDDKR